MKSKKHPALNKPVLLSPVASYFSKMGICSKPYYYLLPELVPTKPGKKFIASRAKQALKDAVKEFSMNSEEKAQLLSVSLCKLLTLYDVEEDQKLFFNNVFSFEKAFGKDISSHLWNRAVADAFCTIIFKSEAHVVCYLNLVTKDSWLVVPGNNEAVELLAMYVYGHFIACFQTERALAKEVLESFRRAARVLKVKEKVFTAMLVSIADYYEKDYRHPIAKVIRNFIASCYK